MRIVRKELKSKGKCRYCNEEIPRLSKVVVFEGVYVSPNWVNISFCNDCVKLIIDELLPRQGTLWDVSSLGCVGD